MATRKELINEYKNRKISGGVFRILNTVTGKYILKHAVDLKGSRNLFDFAVQTGMCFDSKAQKDWDEYGAKTFTFEVLEEIEINEDQSSKEFKEDLKALEELWREKLDLSMEY